MTYTHTADTPVTDPIGTLINIDGGLFTIGPETEAFQWPLDRYDYTIAAPDSVLREILEDLSYGWEWFSAVTIDFDAPESHPVLTCGYWDDGEVRPVDEAHADYTVSTATRAALRQALKAIADGTVTADGYQQQAASDFLIDYEDADGDAITTDLVVQQALFGKIVFG